MSSYRLASQVTLEIHPEGGGSLFISHPQRILKLSPGGVKALQQLCGGGLTDPSPVISEFADNLENQGIITREFAPLRDELLPSVSVVIPTFGRPKMLERCLESLRTLDYPRDRLEIIVVDDASPQALDPANWAPDVRLFRLEENQGPGAARNLAVKRAKGELIAFLDDDCIVDQSWLRALVPCFQEPDVAIVGGRVEAADMSSSLGKYEQVQSSLFMGKVQRKVRKGGTLSYLPTCNLLIRKTIFLAVGGFDSLLRVGEDVDLCWRVLDYGATIYYLPSGLVYHYHRTRLIPFLHRRYIYGQSEAKLQKKHRSETRQLSLFPGHIWILAASLIIGLLVGSLFGKNLGLFFSVISFVVIDMFGLWVQIAVRRHQVKAAGYSFDSRQVSRSVMRARNSALFLYSQHFSRYYSIILTICALPWFPMLAVLFLIIQLWPAVVDYGIKKPEVYPAVFFLFYCLENYCYQAGVISGCAKEHNLRPLAMSKRSP